MMKTVRSQGIDTPTKAAIVRDFNLRGGANVRGAATATAKKFKLSRTSLVKKYDQEIRDNDARRKNCKAGRKSGFTDSVASSIQAVFKEHDTQTFKEAAETIGLPTTALYDYATKNMDFRYL